MSGFAISSLAIAVLLLLVALRSVATSFRIVGEENGGDRALVAMHEAAKAGFWLALAAFFAGSALLDDVDGLRWFLLVPIVMAGLRMIAAALLSR